jgi:predicted RNA methylase
VQRTPAKIRRQQGAPARDHAAERPLWLFLTEPGLGSLLLKELKYHDVVFQKTRTTLAFMRNYDLLVLPEVQLKSRSIRSRMALHAMICPVFGRFKVSETQLDLLARYCRKERVDGLVSSVAGGVFQRQDIMRWIQKRLSERGVRLATGQPSKRPLWLVVIDEQYYFGFPRFNHHDAPSRSRSADRSGSLPPAIAAACVFAAKPREHEVVWDPVMGTGTVLREVAEQFPDADLIGSDCDPQALSLARANLASVPGARLMLADSTAIDLGRSDLSLTLANLPFGTQFKAEGGNSRLYEGILRRSLAHASGQWRASLLTSDGDALRTAVASIGALNLEKLIETRVRGHPAALWLVTPQSKTRLPADVFRPFEHS